jgi:hypothetical protein
VTTPKAETRVSKCRLCGGSGPDPWLGEHACAGDFPVPPDPADEIYKIEATIAMLRRKTTSPSAAECEASYREATAGHSCETCNPEPSDVR